MQECRKENILSLDRFDFQTAEGIFLQPISRYITERTIEMSDKSDAMRIVMELIEDTIGRIVLRDAKKTKKIVEEQEIAMKDDMIEVDKAEDDKTDWVKIIDSEKNDMWWINAVESDKEKFIDAEENEETKVDKSESGMVKFVDAMENDRIKIDKEESGKTEIDEVKFVPYDKMNFNWKKVQALYQGQSKW